MYCGACGKQLNTEDAFCRQCGKPVPIEPSLELVASEMPAKQDTFAKKLLAALGLSLFVLLLLIALKDHKPDEPQTHLGEVKTHDSPCAKAFNDAEELVGAARDNDVVGFTSLSVRKDAYLLPKGTQVNILTEYSSIDGISVEAGLYRGVTCWIPKSLVTSYRHETK